VLSVSETGCVPDIRVIDFAVHPAEDEELQADDRRHPGPRDHLRCQHLGGIVLVEDLITVV